MEDVLYQDSIYMGVNILRKWWGEGERWGRLEDYSITLGAESYIDHEGIATTLMGVLFNPHSINISCSVCPPPSTKLPYLLCIRIIENIEY